MFLWRKIGNIFSEIIMFLNKIELTDSLFLNWKHSKIEKSLNTERKGRYPKNKIYFLDISDIFTYTHIYFHDEN